MTTRAKGSIFSAILWMLLLSVLLFWLPLLGPLIAGFVGGKKAGGVGAAIVAVLLPGILFGAALFLFASVVSGMPLLGAVAGMGGLVLSLAHVGPLLLGAIVGGLFA